MEWVHYRKLDMLQNGNSKVNQSAYLPRREPRPQIKVGERALSKRTLSPDIAAI